MKIDYLDGLRLKQAIIAGARRVILMQDHLNKINVFPVPDSDTGTNMALTMQSIAEGAISCREESISAMSRCLADSALMGARGNSGAILAQFFQGLSERFQGEMVATRQCMAEASEQARISSYEAITEPREGTILTVIHDWSERIKKSYHKSSDIFDLLKQGLSEAQHSLKETPKKLKLLAKAGVVDAGAQGFVNMLEGMQQFMQTGKIDKGVGIGSKDNVRAKVEKAPQDITFQFCTECLISGESIDRQKLRQKLNGLGNSLIVAGSAKIVRIHIHTNEPKTVFSIAKEYGTVAKQKIDDMRKQHVAAYGQAETRKLAIVTDTACDLTPEFVIRHNIQMVPIQLSFGNENFIDKITITPKEFYRMLEESGHYPKTSQPTPGEFKKTYHELFDHYDEIISIHLSSAVSGTLQAAETAAKLSGNDKVNVINSRNLSVGLGLIVAEAAKAIEEELALKEIIERVEWAAENVQFFIGFKTVEYLIRGGRLSRSRGLLAKLLNLKPIVTLDSEGKIQTVAKSLGEKAILKKIMGLVCENAYGKKNLRFAVAHANAPESANWLDEQIKKQFETREVMIVNVSPGLGAHAGPGAAGVAFLGE